MKAALFDDSHRSKSMTLNEVKLVRPSPSVLLPPTIKGFLLSIEVEECPLTH
jgi:hypothetical protein